MKFWISVFGVFLVAHTASASYELLLVADTVNKSIRRFDPQSHAYFGSFGDDILQNPIGLAVDPSLGVCYVAEASSFLIHVYNYSTGEYIRGLTIGASSPGPRLSLDSSGNLIFVGNNSGGIYNPLTGATIRSWTVLGTMGATAFDPGTNQTYMVNYNTETISAYNSSSSAAVFTTPVGPALSTEGDMVLANGSATFVDGTSTLYRWNKLSGNAHFTALSYGTFTSMSALSRGHGSYYAGGTLTAGGFGIARISDGFAMGPSWGSSSLSSVGQMAIVVAPEPSVWFGMSFGLLSLAVVSRRRRK